MKKLQEWEWFRKLVCFCLDKKDALFDEWKQLDKRKLLIKVLPYVLVAYQGNKMAELYFRCDSGNVFITVWQMLLNFGHLFDSWMISINPIHLFFGIITSAGLYGWILYKRNHSKKYRQGQEYGSARWGTSKDVKPFMDADFRKNIPLTETERLTMNNRPKNPKYARNKNIICYGGSGSGKTRFFIKPSLMQMHSSYVVTDPKGTLIIETGKMLEENGYRIKVLNTINFKKSMHYNPFAYIRSEKDILKLVQTIIANTKGEGEKSTEDFWVKAERLLYTALIAFIWYEGSEEEKNFATLLDLIDESEVREEDETYKNPVDIMFDDLAEREPKHFAVRQYKKYKLAAGKTAKSILVSCGARLAPFDSAATCCRI